MSPAEIGILLHYYVSGEDHPKVRKQPQAAYYGETMRKFFMDDLIKSCGDGGRLYMLTFRGECFVQMLLTVQPPTSQSIAAMLSAFHSPQLRFVAATETPAP